jgi:transposase
MDNTCVLEFEKFQHFAGFDWAKQAHEVVVVDCRGSVVLQQSVDHTAEGWAKLREKLAPFEQLAVAIETNQGPAVERLIEMGVSVYPMNPKAAERYRDRKAPSGVKDDHLDAWSFADALRTDGHGWRSLRPDDEDTRLLRLLCRDEISLIEQRTAFVNQLQAALHEYYPAALEAFDEWATEGPWNFIRQFPTPAILVKAGKRQWRKFLAAHRLNRPETADKRMEIFARADQFASTSSAVTTAKSLLAVSLAKQLRTLEAQLKEYRRQIQDLFEKHPDHDIFDSLPGAGPKIAPRLLGEMGAQRDRFDTHEALQCVAGTAPVTKQSGRTRFVSVRWMCNSTLRATVHMWADLSRHQCAWAQAYYQHKRQQGKRHATALRCLGQRWLKILWKMWHDRVPYDEARHMRDQVKHGSWVMALQAAAQA